MNPPVEAPASRARRPVRWAQLAEGGERAGELESAAARVFGVVDVFGDGDGLGGEHLRRRFRRAGSVDAHAARGDEFGGVLARAGEAAAHEFCVESKSFSHPRPRSSAPGAPGGRVRRPSRVP